MGNIALHLDAGHDHNGNPKRLVMVLDEKGDIVHVAEEGYAGVKAALRRGEVADAVMGPRLEITPKEYKAILAEWDEAGEDEDDEEDTSWPDEERHHRKPEPAMHPDEDE